MLANPVATSSVALVTNYWTLRPSFIPVSAFVYRFRIQSKIQWIVASSVVSVESSYASRLLTKSVIADIPTNEDAVLLFSIENSASSASASSSKVNAFSSSLGVFSSTSD